MAVRAHIPFPMETTAAARIFGSAESRDKAHQTQLLVPKPYAEQKKRAGPT